MIPFSSPVAPIKLWEVSSGPETVEFFLEEIQITDQSASAVALTGKGFFIRDGEQTQAVFDVGGLGSLVRANFAAVVSGGVIPVADGGSMFALLGIAIVGLETLRKRR